MRCTVQALDIVLSLSLQIKLDKSVKKVHNCHNDKNLKKEHSKCSFLHFTAIVILLTIANKVLFYFAVLPNASASLE